MTSLYRNTILSKKDWAMSFGIDDDGEQSQFDGNCQDDGLRYRIADV